MTPPLGSLVPVEYDEEPERDAMKSFIAGCLLGATVIATQYANLDTALAVAPGNPAWVPYALLVLTILGCGLLAYAVSDWIRSPIGVLVVLFPGVLGAGLRGLRGWFRSRREAVDEPLLAYP